MPQNQPAPVAPYLPWKIFLASFDAFAKEIPHRLSRGSWQESGLVQGQLMGAYRFLGLIDNDDKPTDVLAALVEDDDDRPRIIGVLLEEHYPELLARDLKTMTMEMLNDLMGRYRVGGATRRKAITFFLHAAKFSGMRLSPSIQVRNSSPRRRRGQGNGNGGNSNVIPPATETQKKTVALKSGGTVSLLLSLDLLSLSEADRNFVLELGDRLNSYNQGKQPAKSLGEAGTRAAHAAEKDFVRKLRVGPYAALYRKFASVHEVVRTVYVTKARNEYRVELLESRHPSGKESQFTVKYYKRQGDQFGVSRLPWAGGHDPDSALAEGLDHILERHAYEKGY